MLWLPRLLLPVMLWWLAQPPAPFRRLMRPLAWDSRKQKAALVPVERWAPVGSLRSATTARHSARVSDRAPVGALHRSGKLRPSPTVKVPAQAWSRFGSGPVGLSRPQSQRL